MIVKFFNRGKGGGASPINYLLGKDRQRVGATLLRGNPDETAAIIDGSPYAKKYTSGVLSFEERDILHELKIRLMDGFEECLFAGLDRDQYNCLWVEHRDKGRLELNFVIPNIELLSGKRLQPYFHKADHKRVDAWRTMQNLQFGFSDPDAPEKRQILTFAQDLPKSAREIQAAITNNLMNLALAGQIRDRADVVQVLENAGFKISRMTGNSISLENPEQGKRNIRLKGAFYEENFRFSETISTDYQSRTERHRAESQARFAAASASYSGCLERKRAENHRRHSRAKFESEPNGLQTLSLDFGRFIGGGGCLDFGKQPHGWEKLPSMGGISGNQGKQREIGQVGAANSNFNLHRAAVGKDIPLRSGFSEFATMGQEWGISGNFATSEQVKGEHHDRNRNRIIERIGELGAQSESDRAANFERIGKIGATISHVSWTTRGIQGTVAYIQRCLSGIKQFCEWFGFDTKRDYSDLDRAIGNTKEAKRTVEQTQRAIENAWFWNALKKRKSPRRELDMDL